MKRAVNVSIVIHTHEREKSLLRLLSSIKEQTVLIRELILVENTTRKIKFSTYKLDKFFDHSLKCRYFSTSSSNIAVSRNISIYKASQPIIVFLDDDVVIDRKYVEKVWNLHKKYSDTVLVGRIEPFKKTFLTAFWGNYLSFNVPFSCATCSLDCYSSAAFSIKREFLARNRIIFNESYRFNNGEDVDFFIRLSSLGGKLLFHRDLTVKHDFKTSFLGFIKRQYEYGYNFASLSKNLPKYFSIEEYFPCRKREWLFFPLFFVRLVQKKFSEFKNIQSSEITLLFSVVIQQMIFIIAIYSSVEGFEKLKSKLRQSWNY